MLLDKANVPLLRLGMGGLLISFVYRARRVNKCMKYSCYVLTKQVSLQLVMTFSWWIVLSSHCIYRVSTAICLYI